MFMNGEPSRRLQRLVEAVRNLQLNSLIKEDLAVLLASSYSLSKPHTTPRMGFRTLQETAIAPYGIVHAILCSPMEFCFSFVSEGVDNRTLARLPSEAKTMGLSGLDGSVRQKTSAKPSDASRR